MEFWRFSDSLIPFVPCCSLVLHQDTPQSLSYGLNMHRSCRTAPDRVFSDQFGAKARALAMLGRQPATYRQSEFVHPGVGVATRLLSDFLWVSFSMS